MKQSKIKTGLILLIIMVLCLSVGAYAGYTLSATDVTYTKSDGTTVSVSAALDELHAKESKNDMEKAVGDEVTVGGEQFYVLECDKYSRVATLISKYNLNTAGTAQVDAGSATTACAFSSTNYWSSSFTSSPFNLNDIIGFTSTDAMGKAKSYGESKGAVSSRLLSYEEANELKTKASSDTRMATMLWGKANTSDGYLLYWLGSSSDSYGKGGVYAMAGSNRTLGNIPYSTSNSPGVRPVITVLKSSIS